MKKYYFHVIQNGNNNGKYSISKEGAITLGRGENNQIKIQDSYVSKNHCKLKLADNGVLSVIDLQSTNGTFINGNKITPNIPQIIHSGDVLTFSEKDFNLQLLIEQKSAQLIKNNSAHNAANTNEEFINTKECQFCGEKILQKADVCKFCGKEQLTNETFEKYISEIKGQPLVNLIVFVAAFAFFSVHWLISIFILAGYLAYHWLYYVPELKKKHKVEIVRLYNEKISRKRYNKMFFAAGVLGLTIILVITNPSKEDFKDFLKENLSKYLTQQTGVSNNLTNVLVNSFDDILPSQFDNFILKKDFVVCSVYSIEISILSSSDDKIEFLGIFGFFIPLDRRVYQNM